MKTSSRSIFNIFTFLVLLAMLTSIAPVSRVHAETLARPLFAGGDFLLARQMGGASDDEGKSIVTDSFGYTYTSGYFTATSDFDPGAGAANLSSAGGRDIFISNIDINGDFVWAKSMGGTNDDVAYDIALDSSGNVYTIGYFYSPVVDFDPGAGTANLINTSGGSIFISKLDGNGNFIWAKSMDGPSGAFGYAIAIDSNDNIYTVGVFQDTVDFDPDASTANLTSAGGYDMFISKLNSNGDFVWAKRVGGSGSDHVSSLALDSNGNIYTTGYFYGTADFDPNLGTANLISTGEYDIFVSKLDSSGDFVWAKSMGGTSFEYGAGLALDSSGNIYTIGNFQGIVDFNPNAGLFNMTSNGGNDIFISKLDNSGNFIWAKSVGGTGGENGTSITLDSANNIYTTGNFANTVDFNPAIAGVFDLTSAGSKDIFVSMVDSNGSFIWAKKMGGIGDDGSQSITLNPSGRVYTTGYFQDTVDFDPGAGISNLIAAGLDIFVSKLDDNDNIAPAVFFIGRENANPTSASSVEFNVGFYNSVSGLDAGDFILTTSGSVSGAAVSGGSGSGSSYSITVNTGSGNGTIRLDLVDDDSVTDGVNPLGGIGAGNGNFSNGQVYTIIKSPTFADVPLDYWANAYIERLYNAGITGGCSANPLNYCPDSTVTRAQMAVFLLKSVHGKSYTPPAVGGSTGFTDVPTDYWAAAWIKQLAAEGITGGCGNGNYCPDNTVTRAQMAVFLMKAKHGSIYLPSNAAGVFSDVPIGYWADKWIEQLAAEGVTSGCGVGVYCPDAEVTRAQMAVFLVKTFNLP